MTGLERNSDVVAMAAYAPLFCNANHKRWPINLINFDSTRNFGIPSYYAQKLFAQNRGDVVLPVAVNTPVAKSLHASATRDQASGDVILKVVNVAADAQAAVIQLNGCSQVTGPARAVRLTSEAATDENTLQNPTKVVPIPQLLPVTGTTLEHTFPGNSLTIIRVRVQ